MKKTILIVCAVLATLSLTAYGYINWSNQATEHKIQSQNNTNKPDNYFVNLIQNQAELEFFYDIAPRFIKRTTKEDLCKAKSIQDLFSKDEILGIDSFRDVNIVVLPREAKKFTKGDGDEFNAAQLKLLQSIDYSNEICIEAFSVWKNAENEVVDEQCFVYYISIVPEKKAEYKEGQKALIDYLKEHSKKESASVSADKLEPGILRFIITKNGKIDYVKLESTSGYKTVDQKMIELISNLPGEWEPASDSNGNKVDQELVLFFGMIGC